MSDLRKAAEMALKHLDNVSDWDTTYSIGMAKQALRQALAQPVDAVNMSQERVDETAKDRHEPVAWINYNAATGEETINRDCHSELASTPLYKISSRKELICVCGAVWDGELMTIPPRKHKQEPVAWMYEWDNRKHLTFTDQSFVEKAHPHFNKSTPLYTAPPKCEWVGLTHDEVNSWELPDLPTVFEFAQFIEAKLKEKNK